jgi:hypothetical protein
MQLNRAQLGLNFIKNIISKILVLFLLNMSIRSKVTEEMVRQNRDFGRLQNGYFLITFERLNGICPSLNSIHNFHCGHFKVSTIKIG